MATSEVLVSFKGDNKDLKKSAKDAEDSIKGLGTEADKTDEKLKEPGEQAPKTEKKISDSFGKATKAVAGLAVAAAGTALAISSISFDFDANTAVSKVTAALNLTEGQSKIAGDIAGEMYADGFGESIGDLGLTIEAVMSSFGKNLPKAELKSLTTDVNNLARAFEVDVAEATASASVLITNGLAKDGSHAMDLLTSAMQNMPAGIRDEALPALSEYSKSFAQLGLTGEQSISLLAKASEQGIIGVDKMGDAIKEFTIRSTDMSALTQEAYKKIGVSSKDMTNAFLEGGPAASKAMGEVVSGLQNIKDPGEQAAAALALFGTPLEDLGTENIPAFLASMSGADGQLENVAGSAGKLAKQLGEQSAPMEKFNRALESTMSEVLKPIIPYLDAFAKWAQENPGKIKLLTQSMLGLVAVVTALVAVNKVHNILTGDGAKKLGSYLIKVKNSIVWIAKQSSALAKNGVMWVKSAAKATASFVKMRAAAVKNAALTSAAWVRQASRAGSAWIAQMAKAAASSVKTAAKSVATATVTAGAWVAGALATAAAWLVANAVMLGIWILVIAAVIAVVYLIIKYWDTIKQWFTNFLTFMRGVWDWIWNKVKTVINFIILYFKTMFNVYKTIFTTIVTVARTVWDWIWQKISTVIGWVVAYFAFLKDTWALILTTIRDKAVEIWDKITSTITGVVDKVKAVWNGIVAWFKGIWDKVTSGATSVKDAITGAFKGAIEGAKNAFKSGINWIIDKINILIKGANKATGVLSKIPGVPNIKVDEIKRVATGGYIQGAGHGTSDSVPAMLSNGEFVLRASAVRALGLANVEALNDGQIPNGDQPLIGQIIVPEGADPMAFSQHIGALVKFA